VAAGIIGALALAALALTAALAVYCFVKVVGLVLLGAPRRAACADAVEAPWAMRAGLVILAGWCVVLGALPGPLAMRCASILPGSSGLTETRLHPPGTGGLPTLGLAAALLGLVAVLRLARGRRAAPAPTWACGQRCRAPRSTGRARDGLDPPRPAQPLDHEGGRLPDARHRPLDSWSASS